MSTDFVDKMFVSTFVTFVDMWLKNEAKCRDCELESHVVHLESQKLPHSRVDWYVPVRLGKVQGSQSTALSEMKMDLGDCGHLEFVHKGEFDEIAEIQNELIFWIVLERYHEMSGEEDRSGDNF